MEGTRLMRITHVRANNWRNFKSLDFPIRDRLFIVGPNAAGKSNLLDLFRFLADVASPGGGIAAAFKERGGLGKVRSLFARNWQKGRLTIDIRLMENTEVWRARGGNSALSRNSRQSRGTRGSPRSAPSVFASAALDRPRRGRRDAGARPCRFARRTLRPRLAGSYPSPRP